MLLDQLLAAGLVVVHSGPCQIRVIGPELLVQQWAGQIAASKTELLVQLERGDPPALLEYFEERAAIMEFGGGMSRDQAEQLAWEEVMGNHSGLP